MRTAYPLGYYLGMSRTTDIATFAARRADGALVLYPGNGRGGWLAPRDVGTAWQGMDEIL